MAATTSLRVYTGTDAGTESAPQTGIALLSTDSAGTDPDAAEVAPGTNSFEKWLRVKVDGASGMTLTNFWVERSGDLPDGVAIKLGVTDTPATPTNATSTVATTTMADGRRYFFDNGTYSEDGDVTRYLVLQEQVAQSAASGAIDQQAFTIGYSQS